MASTNRLTKAPRSNSQQKESSLKDDHVIDETKEYYRQRASQYSDWSRRTGKHEGGSEPDESFFGEAKMLLDALDSEKLTGDVLEIASGTGIWTEALTRHATSITALDSSQEMIDRCKTRLKGNPKVQYVHADFYAWTPDRHYDAVTFSFWISHVPSWKLDEFTAKISHCLRRRGRVFFVDQQRSAMKYEVMDQPGGEIASRTLEDGKTFNVVKHFYVPEEITRSLRKNGIETRVSNTPNHFYYARGEKAP